MKLERYELLNNVLKAIKYRFEKATNGSLESFGEFRLSDQTRSPSEIVNHMFDLVNKTNSIITGGEMNTEIPVLLKFDEECHRFVVGLEKLMTALKKSQIDLSVCMKLLQGPILDITTHIGQIALLNGLNGNKIGKENYYALDL
ncbi:MAG TPA: hypothetical protein VK175_12785 [Leadbetterella sp.]|nr:hypothetical protein [Leadbetterella sp.]